MFKVKAVKSREILDSRGNPTIETDITLESGDLGRAAVPAGASTGSREALELRDGDPQRFSGKGVQKAVQNVNEIIGKEIIGKEFDQSSLDKKLKELDGTENKSRLGANALLSVSMAFAQSAAVKEARPLWQYLKEIAETDGPPKLPIPMFNVLNGGRHAENSTDIQEFMIMPVGAKSFRAGLQTGAEIYQTLKEILSERRMNTAVGDEGGFCPVLHSNESAIGLIIEAIEKTGLALGKDIALGLDAAATELMEGNAYRLRSENKVLNSEELVELYENWTNKYPIRLIEDGLAENDIAGWKRLTQRLDKKLLLVGDDLFVTNKKILAAGIKEKMGNAILIKLNQIGTVTETLEAIQLARDNNYEFIISHRSGETEDTTISHLAVGTGAPFIKAGAPARGERTAKYNELLRIEEDFEKYNF